jgi:hypothetical protein
LTSIRNLRALFLSSTREEKVSTQGLRSSHMKNHWPWDARRRREIVSSLIVLLLSYQKVTKCQRHSDNKYLSPILLTLNVFNLLIAPPEL